MRKEGPHHQRRIGTEHITHSTILIGLKSLVRDNCPIIRAVPNLALPSSQTRKTPDLEEIWFLICCWSCWNAVSAPGLTCWEQSSPGIKQKSGHSGGFQGSHLPLLSWGSQNQIIIQQQKTKDAQCYDGYEHPFFPHSSSAHFTHCFCSNFTWTLIARQSTVISNVESEGSRIISPVELIILQQQQQLFPTRNWN